MLISESLKLLPVSKQYFVAKKCPTTLTLRTVTATGERTLTSQNKEGTLYPSNKAGLGTLCQ